MGQRKGNKKNPLIRDINPDAQDLYQDAKAIGATDYTWLNAMKDASAQYHKNKRKKLGIVRYAKRTRPKRRIAKRTNRK